LKTGVIEVEQNLDKMHRQEDAKKLSFVVAVLSLLVIVIFGLVPMV
jgi:hypothetical protein